MPASVALVVSWRTHRLSLGPGCADVPTALSSAPAGVTPIRREDLLVVVLQGPGDLDFSDPSPEVVINDQGEVIAVEHGNSQLPPLTYRRATLAPQTLSGLRACLSSSGFQSLADSYDRCISGGNEAIISGPTAGTSKKVWAKFHSTDATGGCSSLPPDELVALKRSLDALAAQAAATGTPSQPPPDSLTG